MKKSEQTQSYGEIMAQRKKRAIIRYRWAYAVFAVLFVILGFHMPVLGNYIFDHYIGNYTDPALYNDFWREFKIFEIGSFVLPIILLIAYFLDVRALDPWYARSKDKSGYIMKAMGNLARGHFEIPAEYKEKPVVEIGNLFLWSTVTKPVTSLTIPGSVTAIHRDCFRDKALQEIRFEGTKAQWAAILAKGIYIRTDLVVSCTDGEFRCY